MKRFVSCVVLITMLNHLILSSCLFALSEGPSQPEAMQFEPVDVTDVVNLATGDFSYVIPVMDVPGPGGSFPIALSYHSGIGVNQEATWVGLGWSLNPGAINRSPSGYPDDYKGAAVNTTFDAEKSGRGAGITIGKGPVGLNLKYSSHSGQLGANAIFGLTSANSANFQALLTIGSSGVNLGIGYKDNFGALGSADFGVDIGTTGLRASGKYTYKAVTVSQDQNGVGLSARITDKTGFTLSSNGNSSTLMARGVGLSSTAQPQGQGVRSESGLKIPISAGPVDITLSYTEWEWKLDELITDLSYGYMYQDAYHLSTEANKKFERQLQDKFLYPTQDIYNVKAQGISGSFMPFSRDGFKLRDIQNYKESGTLLDEGFTNHDIVFRFLGDQGTNFVMEMGTTGWSDENENYFGDRFASKKISPTTDSTSGKLTGFIVKDIDGKIYEFSKPVFNNFTYAFTEDLENSTKSTTQMGSPYANNWLITAIKGPDFLDRAPIGQIGEEDWGYWVKFNYAEIDGKQIWRSPYTGRAPAGGSDQVENFSLGSRDIVYLESIETKTHISIFDREISNDRQTAEYDTDWKLEAQPTGVLNYVRIPGKWDDDILSATGDCIYGEYTTSNGQTASFSRDNSELSQPVYDSTLGMTEVHINGFYSNEYLENAHIIPADLAPGKFNKTNLLDKITLYAKTDPGVTYLNNTWSIDTTIATSLKTADFIYDYSLCANTPSSVDPDGGKLTLKELTFFGNGGASSLPGYNFEYANSDNFSAGDNPDFHEDAWDRWGSYRSPISGLHSTPQTAEEANKARAWSLTKISLPSGGNIQVEYESDDYHRANNTHDYFHAKKIEVPAINRSISSTNTININNISTDNFYVGQEIYIHEVELKFNQGCVQADQIDTWSSGTITNIDPTTPSISIDFSYFFQEDGNCYNAEESEFIYHMYITPRKIFGGGIRVKSLTSSDGLNTYKTEYNYETEDGFSTGYTASLPPTYGDKKWAGSLGDYLDPLDEDYEKAYLDNDYSYGRPGPVVLYSEVTVKNVDFSGNSLNGKSVFEFYTSKDYPYSAIDQFGYLLSIEDKSAIYGRPKSTTFFELTNSGNYREIQKEEMFYTFSNELASNGQIRKVFDKIETEPNSHQHLGLTQERYKFDNYYDPDDISQIEGRFVEKLHHSIYATKTLTSQYFYDTPEATIPSQTTTSEIKSIAWDALSGLPIANAAFDSRNLARIQASIPAYWKYQGMQNNNMLTQTTQTTSYGTDIDISDETAIFEFDFTSSANEGLITASEITTWSDLWENDGESQQVWRKNDVYQYHAKLDFSDQISDFDSFNPWSDNNLDLPYDDPTSTSPWQMTSNITAYTPFSQPYEEHMADDRYNSVLYDEDSHLPIAVISGGRLKNTFFDNFEDSLRIHEDWIPAPTDPTRQPHAIEDSKSGKNGVAVYLEYGTNSDIHQNIGEFEGPQDLVVSVWFKGVPGQEGQIYVGDNNLAHGPRHESEVTIVEEANGNWQLLCDTLELGKTEELDVFLYCYKQFGLVKNVIYDDLRIYPVGSSVQTFTYDELTQQVTSITGPNGVSTHFEYDDYGRLIRTFDDDRHLLAVNEYEYGLDGSILAINASAEIIDQCETATFTIGEEILPATASEYHWTVSRNGTVVITATGASLLHQFTEIDTYTIDLEARDSNGHVIATATTDIIVETPQGGGGPCID